MAKWLLNRSLDSDRRSAFDEEAWAQELIVGTADAGEGLRAFAERRPRSSRATELRGPSGRRSPGREPAGRTTSGPSGRLRPAGRAEVS